MAEIKPKDRSMLDKLAEAGLLKHLLAHDASSEQFQYVGQLVRDSESIAKERPKGEYLSLKELAEWEFAVDRHGPTWMIALQYDVSGEKDKGGFPFKEWWRYRAEALGKCFFSEFVDVYEGLPLYLKEGDKFRVATASDSCYRDVENLIADVWPDNQEIYTPPAWSGSLYIKQSDQQIHRLFFGELYDVRPESLKEKGKKLRMEAFRRALRDEGRPSRMVRANLRPITDLWPLVRDTLKISGFQAITFVEDAFERLGLILYQEDEPTGLYIPSSGDVSEILRRMGVSNFAQHFANDNDVKVDRDGEDWSKCCLTPADFEAVLTDAREIAGVPPPASLPSAERVTNKTDELSADQDPALKPRERETLSKLWYFVARSFGFDLSAAKSDAPSKFLRQLHSKCGLEMDPKTVRERMREAMKQFSPASGKERG